MKPHLKLVGDSAVPAARPLTPAVAEARKKHGKPFAHERGAQFVWTSGPSVLTNWLHKRMEAK